MTKHKMKLYPFWDVVREAEKLMSRYSHIHQQFNCAHCGTKQTMEEPNKFYMTGKCEECGQITDIVKDGCNYMAHIALTDKAKEQFDKEGKS